MAACDSMPTIQDYLGQHTGSAGHVCILAHIFWTDSLSSRDDDCYLLDSLIMKCDNELWSVIDKVTVDVSLIPFTHTSITPAS